MMDQTKEIFYEENNICVCRSSKDDLEILSKEMSSGNVEELWVAHHYTPLSALEIALKNSSIALTIKVDGKPCGIFGTMNEDSTGKRAQIYFLVTEDFSKIGRVFLRNSRQFVDMFLESYPYLENHVYSNNVKSIMWMKYIGAKIDEAKPFGIEGKMFHHFSFGATP